MDTHTVPCSPIWVQRSEREEGEHVWKCCACLSKSQDGKGRVLHYGRYLDTCCSLSEVMQVNARGLHPELLVPLGRCDSFLIIYVTISPTSPMPHLLSIETLRLLTNSLKECPLVTPNCALCGEKNPDTFPQCSCPQCNCLHPFVKVEVWLIHWLPVLTGLKKWQLCTKWKVAKQNLGIGFGGCEIN